MRSHGGRWYTWQDLSEPKEEPVKAAILALAVLSAPDAERVEISGKVTKISSVGYSQHTFWGVEDGLGYVRLDDGSACVFDGGVPISLKEGDRCVLEGRKLKTLASGAVLYVECRLANSP